ncbi:TonB-dependent receptor [Dysgonomonas sp. Marseille-P4361]|uniref:SusC/RagA family TonB-linked outer membrane protein n=1 Tax=Dysgonomonas sp. Marseille-P4361 TaxID=2161820 RepID=UPI000D54DE69|nr:TonB-dependent receptor [Dysgonomonas sp. Marseille-P4361]
MKNNKKTLDMNAIFRKLRISFPMFLLLLVLPLLTMAQQESASTKQIQQDKIQVTGVVKDQNGELLIGVTIKEASTTQTSLTDIDGKFSISVSSPNATLDFTYIGMEAKSVKLDGKTYIEVVLKEETSALSEVVVVGYGTQSKVSVTGAVSAVKGDDIKKATATSFGNALQGRITGLSITQSDGALPGLDDARIFLRGRTTINESSPLILIDGVPRENFRTLDVNEIESVSVLKDASATAVFGVRGANGVIMVTTKRGQVGKAELSASIHQTFTAFTRKPDRLSSIEYIDMRNEAFRNDGLPEAYSPEVREKFMNPYLGLDPNAEDYEHQMALRDYLYPNHYYYGMYFKDWVPETRANVNVRGGTETVLYYMNVGYIHQGGHFNTEKKSQLGYDPSLKLDRWSFRSNMDYKPTKFLTTRLNIGTYIEKQNTPPINQFKDVEEMTRGVMQEIMRMNPTTLGPTTGEGLFPDVMPNMMIKPRVGDNSPGNLINRSGYHKNTRINLNSSLEVELDLSSFITEGLSFKGLISFDTYPRTTIIGQRTERDYYADPNYENDTVELQEKTTHDSPMSLGRSSSNHYKFNAQGSINYNRAFGKHNVTGMILIQRDHWESEGAEIPYNVLSFAGRGTYNYDSKYFVEVNLGYNGTEQFAPSNRFGFFPAGSLGWVLTNESFIPKNGILTFLKLRASYGRVGNDKLGSSRFLYQDNYQYGGKDQGVGGLGEGQGVNIILLGNKHIQWEVSDKLNLGVDLQITNDIKGSFDYFKENTSKMLINRGVIPLIQGHPASALPKSNIGELENYGYEFEISYNKQVTPDFFISVNANMSTNNNKITSHDEAMYDDSYAYQYRNTGYQIGQQWGYLVDWDSPGKGYWTSQEEIDQSGVKYPNPPRPGDLVFKDLNGDGEISEKDHAPIGFSGSVPGYNYGFGLDTKYRDFDFSIFFTGVGDIKTYWYGLGVNEVEGKGTYYKYHKNAWTSERYANGEKITYPALSSKSNYNHSSNEFFVQNRAFLRLRNLEIGYTIPKGFLSKIGVNDLRVYVTGQNLFVWDKLLIDQYDPEAEHPRKYPIQKVLGFGVNVTF